MSATVTLPGNGHTRSRATAPAAGRHRRPRTSLAARIRRAAATLVLVLAALLLLGMTLGPRVLHYRTATMLTGSMAPGIRPGDVIVDTLEPATSIAVGQVITYHIPVQDHRVESHRVVWVGRDRDGTVLMRTKGDANSAEDPWTARMDESNVWRVRAVVPVAGKVIRALRQPVAHLILTGVLPALLVIWLLVSIWRRPRSSDQDTGDPAARRPGEDARSVAGR